MPPAHGGGSTAASPAGAQRRQRGSVPAAASPVDGGGKEISLTKYLQLFPFLVVLVVYAVTVLFQDSRVRYIGLVSLLVMMCIHPVRI